ncbi:MAG: phosphatidate cytidylyltransferase [Tumebacillaceae bacterium]
MLRQRVLTGIIGGAVFIGAVFYGHVPFSLLICLLAVVGFSEIVKMRGFGRFSFPALIGYLVTLAFVTSNLWGEALRGFMPTNDAISGVWLLMILFLFFTVSVVTKNRYTFQDVSYLFVGTLYVSLPFHYALLLRGMPTHGLAYFLFLLIAMWTTDTFAYFVGRAVKGPKLWPAISPNKTVSGSVGGVVGAVVFGLIFAEILGVSMAPWMLLAAILSVLGQLGDFVESGLKRSLDVKDSGAILPGHGGVLDRFDSFLFTAPLAYYVIMSFLS